MKKILASVMVLSLVVMGVVIGTRAFFSDTETSVDNVFEAGRLDLQIDNSSWYNGVYNADTSWSLDDITDQLFFDFVDVKPGDWGEDTISLHTESNPSWMCANVTLTQAAENGVWEPEETDGDDPMAFGPWDGELDNEINFVVWVDDGDNGLEDDETVVWEFSGADLPQGDRNAGVNLPIVDSATNVFGAVGEPFPADTTMYLAKAWCFGDMTLAPVPQGSGNPETDPGVVCNGELVTNVSQSDDMMGNIGFYAVQTRHNDDFVCDDWVVTP